MTFLAGVVTYPERATPVLSQSGAQRQRAKVQVGVGRSQKAVAVPLEHLSCALGQRGRTPWNVDGDRE